MELGLSAEEEVRHLDHMVRQEEWRELIGELDEFHLIDASISPIVSKCFATVLAMGRSA